jgi:transglutaminase superfamily protein
VRISLNCAARRLHRFLRLPADDRRMIAQAVWLYAAIATAQSLAPFRFLDRWVGTGAKRQGFARTCDDAVVARVVRAVSAGGFLFPRASCLTRAYVAHRLFTRRGCAVSLRIGARRTAEGRLEAHAWVEHRGRVVVGDVADVASYRPFPRGAAGRDA